MQPDTSAPSTDYYVLDSPYEVARWRPLVNWLLAIPHIVIGAVLGYLFAVVILFYWCTMLFTGKLNPGMYGILTMVERYNVRAEAFLLGFSQTYPPFDLNTGAADNNAHPGVTLNLPEPPASTPRRALFNWLLAIPHYIVQALLGIAALVMLIVGWFWVLFTGAWPRGMRDFLVRLNNYNYRVWVYAAMVETSYPKFPKFSLKP